jgi:ATP-dependent Lhr-like helicase
MLQGFEIAAAAWEPEALSPRVAGYRPEWLDELCLAGEVAYCRLSPRVDAGPRGSTSRATPIAIASRRELGWLLRAVRGTAAPEAPTSPASLATLDALRRRGALFFDDIALATSVSADELTLALWDVVGRGLVAPDGFRPLRDLMASGRRKRARPVHGRWAVVDRADTEPMGADELADRVAGQLLSRYGVVFRELSARESFVVPWRDVARALRRREACGLVRGGRFVSGFAGEQYALPDAVDALRKVRREPRGDVLVRVSATDPLNLVGILTPGPRVPSHPGSWLVFSDGAHVSPADARPSEVAPAEARH